MAIINGKRVKDIYFMKSRGKKNWIAVNFKENYFFGLCVEYDGENPMEEKFYYCSSVAQPVFVDYFNGIPKISEYTDSSFKKMPKSWQKLFENAILS